MSSEEKISGSETQNESLVRGGIGFFGGLLLCGAALAAQAVLLNIIAGQRSAANAK
jgi:hypothetical protein